MLVPFTGSSPSPKPFAMIGMPETPPLPELVATPPPSQRIQPSIVNVLEPSVEGSALVAWSFEPSKWSTPAVGTTWQTSSVQRSPSLQSTSSWQQPGSTVDSQLPLPIDTRPVVVQPALPASEPWLPFTESAAVVPLPSSRPQRPTRSTSLLIG